MEVEINQLTDDSAAQPAAGSGEGNALLTNHDWDVHQRIAYANDAARALQRFVAGERDIDFFERVLDLLRTYLEAPPALVSTNPVREGAVNPTVNAGDSEIINLAKAIHHHLGNLGYWHQIVTLWPRLVEMAANLPDPLAHAELVKQLATILDGQGESERAMLLYAKAIDSPNFSSLPATLQGDLLNQAATTYLWDGHLYQAQKLLIRHVVLADQHPSPGDHRNVVDQRKVRSNHEPTPMWESKAYTLSQLGNVAMFQGDFVEAERRFQACYAIFIEYGEEDNLACVAYQALGRLYLHWGRSLEAIPILEKGIAIRRHRVEQTGTAINSVYLAGAYLQLGEATLAESLLDTALTITRELGNRRDTGLCHLYFGQLERLRGQHDQVLVQWQQALNLLETVPTPLVEQRVWIQSLPWLIRHGHCLMLQAVFNQLFKSARHQKLSPMALARLTRHALR